MSSLTHSLRNPAEVSDAAQPHSNGAAGPKLSVVAGVTDHDLTPRPAAAAWLRTNGDDRVIVQWIAANADRAAYNRRALFIQRSGDLKHASAAVQAY